MRHDHPPEPALTSDAERLRLLVESVTEYAIFMLDPTGVILTWNLGAEKIKGYRAEDIIGCHFSKFYSAEDLAWDKPGFELKEATKNGRFEDEGWRLHKDGTRFWANVVITALRDPQTGELCGFGKVTRDLTDRRDAERKLRESEAQFRLLVERVDEYAIFMLDASGNVATWNAGAEKIKGYTADEIVGQHFSKFYTEEDRLIGTPSRLLQEAADHGHVHNTGVRVRKGGSKFHADVLITALRDDSGTLRGFTKVTRDVTDQIRHQELEASRLAAEKANMAKDEFLAVLSHELRTPLTPVLATTGYLLENLEAVTREELLTALSTIRRNATLEAQLIDDLLDITRISRGKLVLRRERFDVHEALKDAVNICREDAARKQIAVEVTLNAEFSGVCGDPVRLRQVFWNLLSNAVKFTPPNGRISVRSANSVVECVDVEIVDTGFGIEPGQIERIFQPFQQGPENVTRQFGGLGLGLAIVRSILTQHDGSIAASSPGRNQGTAFRVALPCFGAAEAPKVTDERSHPARSFRILLVDDHADTRRILARILTKDGHSVCDADCELAGREELHSGKYDVLITDIGLPDGSGLNLMRAAKELQPGLHGIALSGFGSPQDLERSKAAGFDCHLTKPVDAGELRGVLAKIPRD